MIFSQRLLLVGKNEIVGPLHSPLSVQAALAMDGSPSTPGRDVDHAAQFINRGTLEMLSREHRDTKSSLLRFDVQWGITRGSPQRPIGEIRKTLWRSREFTD